MDTHKITADYRMSQWAQVMQARTDSGQNIRDFCQAAGISKNAYFYWQRKLRQLACSELVKAKEIDADISPRGWVQVAPKQVQATKEVLKVEINGCYLTVNTETDPELLKKVCHILRSLG